MDRDRVINALESAIELSAITGSVTVKTTPEVARRAVEMLKEQETVVPTFKQDCDGNFVWACGHCGAYMYHIYDGIDKAKDYAKYCRQCGKKVKWND